MKTEDMLLMGVGAWLLLGKAKELIPTGPLIKAPGIPDINIQFPGMPDIQMPDIQIQIPTLQVPQIRTPEIPGIPGAAPGIIEGIISATGLSALIPQVKPHIPKTVFGPPGITQAIAQSMALASQAQKQISRSEPERKAITSVKTQIKSMSYLQKKGIAAQKMKAIIDDLSPQARYAREQAIRSQKQHPLPIMKHRPEVERVSKRRVIKRRKRYTGREIKGGGVTRRHKSWFS